jgi:hypothetical protein
MWVRLSRGRRVWVVVVTAAFAFAGALAFAAGNSLRGSMLLSLPLFLLAEAWGDLNPSRRNAVYWAAVAALTAAEACLLALSFRSPS